VSKEASHYVRLFGGNKIGNLIFWLTLFFPTLCDGCAKLMYSIVPWVGRIPDFFIGQEFISFLCLRIYKLYFIYSLKWLENRVSSRWNVYFAQNLWTEYSFKKSVLFWVISQQLVVNSYRCFKELSPYAVSFLIGLLDPCSKMSVRNTTTRCVITQKSTVIYFVAEAWNHAVYSFEISELYSNDTKNSSPGKWGWCNVTEREVPKGFQGSAF
jgi:hypothetical protein